MLYLNEDAKIQEKEYEWGKLRFIELGEHGRGRHAIRLPVPFGYKENEIKAGLHKDLSIGLSKSGKERIIQSSDHEMYMALSAEGGYTRRGCGRIYMPVIHENEIRVLQIGNGADGDAGRIGQWNCALIKVPANKDLAICVSPSGNYDDNIYMLHDGEVYAGSEEDMRFACDAMDITPPFSNASGFWYDVRFSQGAKEFGSQAEQITDTIMRHSGTVRFLDLSALSSREKADIFAKFVTDDPHSFIFMDERREDMLGLWRSDKHGIEISPQTQEAMPVILHELLCHAVDFPKLAPFKGMVKDILKEMSDEQKTSVYHKYKELVSGVYMVDAIGKLVDFMPDPPASARADFIQGGGKVVLDARHAELHSCRQAGSEWESQLTKAVESQHVFDTENVRVFITDGPYTAASYYSPVDEETKAATVTLDAKARMATITIAFENGGTESRSAKEIIHGLGDPEPEGRDGVASSSWKIKMGAKDLVEAVIKVEEAIDPPTRLDRIENLKDIKKGLESAIHDAVQERGLTTIELDVKQDAPSL